MALGITLTQFLITQKNVSGELASLLMAVATAGKILSREISRAGLVNLLGQQGTVNVHGEQVQKLDQFANDIFIKTVSPIGCLAGIASEEMEEIYVVPDGANAPYLFLMDPLDGSSNIDVNISIGSIFSIHRRRDPHSPLTTSDFLQKGSEQVCGGYILYGPSTMLIYTTGTGVHGFTLDQGIGEFLLSHENIQTPARGSIYSINEANEKAWDQEGMRQYLSIVKTQKKTARYVGSLVGDVHRNLLKGGLFIYPSDQKNKQGKLRLLYEASPLAFVVEQAGGKATNGIQPILEIVPEMLHQRVPLAIGSREDIEEVGRCLSPTR